jgi:hypothetical protein
VVCAVLGLATYAVGQTTGLNKSALIGFSSGGDLSAYTSVAALVLALLAWHASPRWAWPVLVALGGLCAVPAQFLLLSRDNFMFWMWTPLRMVDAAALPLLLVGLLGAAAAVWQAGRRGVGAVLLGTPLVVAVLTGFVVSTFRFESADFLPVAGLVLAVATTAAALVALVGAAPVSRPEWRVTVGGVVASAASMVYQLWPAPGQPAEGEYAIDTAVVALDGYFAGVGQHLVAVGLVVVGVVLLGGLVAGPRVLVTGVAAGLLLAAPATLVGPLAMNIYGVSTGTASLLALVALAVGVAVALSRARMAVGLVGLGVAAVWLLVLWLVSRPTDFAADNLGLVMVVLVAAVVPTLAALGTLLTPAEIPAAFAGVAAGISVGVSGISMYWSFFTADDEARHVGTYLLVTGSLVVAAGLVVLAHRRWGRPADREPALENA